MWRIILAGIVFFCLSSCKFHDSDLSDLAIFRYNESKGITSLDPAYARNQTVIWPVIQLFNGLVQLDDSLNVKPCIARSWRIEEGGKKYVFHLRSDVRFHPSGFFTDSVRFVKASDFVYSFNRICDPAVGSPGIWIFDQVDPGRRFTAPDDTTFVLWLREPFSPFLSMLTMPYCSVVPEEAVKGSGEGFGRNPVGTGPFVFRFWSTDEKLVMVRNNNYFEKDPHGNRLPYLDAVNINFVKDKQSEFLEFMKGNLDFLSGVHPVYKDELLTRSGTLNPKYRERFNLISQPYLNTEYLGFLVDPAIMGEDHPLMDKRIRQAINYGFDREKMMKYLRNNLGKPATGGFIPLGLEGGLPPGSGYGYAPEMARRLMEEAGYPDGSGLPVLELTTTSDYLDLCEFIQFELNRIGISLKINVSTGASFRNMVANSNLPFFRGSWIADYADGENYLALFYSENFSPAGPNYTHFKSGSYDRLYRMARETVNDTIRFELYREMERIILDEAPVVLLYYDMVVRFAPLTVRGFESNPMNLLNLKSVYISDH